jgi:hypothetical protein
MGFPSSNTGPWTTAPIAVGIGATVGRILRAALAAFGDRDGAGIGLKSAAPSSATKPAGKPPASVLNDQLSELGQEVLQSAKRLATDPVHRRKIQKQLV